MKRFLIVAAAVGMAACADASTWKGGDGSWNDPEMWDGGVPDADRRTLRMLLERIRTPQRSQAVRTAQILVIQDRPRGLPPPRATRKRLTGARHLF